MVAPIPAKRELKLANFIFFMKMYVATVEIMIIRAWVLVAGVSVKNRKLKLVLTIPYIITVSARIKKIKVELLKTIFLNLPLNFTEIMSKAVIIKKKNKNNSKLVNIAIAGRTKKYKNIVINEKSASENFKPIVSKKPVLSGKRVLA